MQAQHNKATFGNFAKTEWVMVGILAIIGLVIFAFPQILVFPDVGEYVVERVDLTQNSLIDLARINTSETALRDIVIIEFTDFECPFCAQAQSSLEFVRTDDRVTYLHRHFPQNSIHPNANGAAHIYECAREIGQEDLAREMLFAKYDDLSQETFTQILDTLGIPVCAGFGEVIAHDKKLAQYFSVAGTPSFVVIPMSSPESYVLVEGADVARINALINTYATS